jgi:type I restriction enzyme M protein
MVEADVVDCMVALPGQLFYATQIPVCLWILAKNKARRGFRKRKGEVLFIDARKLGTLVDRVHRELTTTTSRASPHLPRVARREGRRRVRGRAGLLQERHARRDREPRFVLTPGRYVGAEEVEEDGEPFEEKMKRF